MKSFLPLISLLLSIHCVAQNNWIYSFSEHFTSILPVSHNRLLLTSGFSSYGGPQGVYEVDSTGNLVWGMKYTTDWDVKEMVQVPNNQFMIGTSIADTQTLKKNPTIICIDSAGSVLWSKYFKCDTADVFLSRLARTTDQNNIIIGLSYYGHMGALIKVNDAGNILWSKKGDSSTNFNSVFPAENGTLLIARINDLQQTDIMKVSATGNTLWNSTYTFGSIPYLRLCDAEILPSGNYLFTLQAYQNPDSVDVVMLETSMSGDIIRAMGYNLPGQANMYGASTTISPDSGVVCALSTVNNKLIVMKNDSILNNDWVNMSTDTWAARADVEFTGQHMILSYILQANPVMLRTESMLTDFNCFVSDTVDVIALAVQRSTASNQLLPLSPQQFNFSPVVTVATLTPTAHCYITDVPEADREVLTPYPNPATTSITFDGQNIRRISIFDTRGQITIIATTKVVNIDGLPDGLYFYEVETDDGMFRGRFQKQN
jgi:hypothetical protein